MWVSHLRSPQSYLLLSIICIASTLLLTFTDMYVAGLTPPQPSLVTKKCKVCSSPVTNKGIALHCTQLSYSYKCFSWRISSERCKIWSTESQSGVRNFSSPPYLQLSWVSIEHLLSATIICQKEDSWSFRISKYSTRESQNS